ncbi:Retrovirus-related Pol polyprotein from transposon [Smittium culicis]|uniref:Retrovirus-related Pol polyprotein from transposon n=1 Tax=Smittium culicis TaxID=133412 RepID=A0A1R1X0B1_9FUNG|nr:Retrovirus-related Pol polyprotein from transposon [Smittium culicis]
MLKNSIAESPVLARPQWEKKFIETTDASGTGVGAILSQEMEGVERLIAYASRSLSVYKKNYSKTHLEDLGVVWAIKEFKNYLYAKPFEFVTDHSALVQIFRNKELTGSLARWNLFSIEFKFEINHMPGSKNPTDYLSRKLLKAT